jgi:hypothetical protein
MTILETITGVSLLIVGLIASTLFYHQIDCYHELSVQAVELRLAPLEHNDSKTFSLNRRCSGLIKRQQHQIHILYQKTHHYTLLLNLEGKL